MRPLHLAPLVLALLVSFALRWMGGDELVLGPSEAGAIESGVLIDDAGTCAHLRGVALALPLARAPEHDAFLDHPEGAERPCVPFFDTLVASLAGRFLGAQSDAVGPAGGLERQSEARVEQLLLRIPPLVGFLTALCAWAAMRAACRGPAREWCALLAAAVVGLAPASIAASSAGRLEPLAWCALVLALLSWIVARALRAHELREGLIAALTAGACAGLLCASLLAGVLFFLAAWAGFAVRAWRAPAEERRAALREALLFGCVAAFAGQLPLAEQPELGTGLGTLALAWQAMLQLVLLACVPLLVAFAFGSGRSGRFFQAAVGAVAVVALLYYLPTIVRSIDGAWSAYRVNAPLFALFDGGARPLLTADTPLADWLGLSPLVLLLPVALWVLAREAAAGEREWLIGAALVGVLLALVERRFAAVGVVPVACALARALDLASTARAGRAVLASLAALVLLIATAFAVRAPARSADERVARVELARAWRWMRDGTPAPQVTARAQPSYGVLVPPQDAAAALYHARRPVVATPQALVRDGHALLRALDALAGGSDEALVRYMHERGARYLAVGPSQVRATLELQRASAVGRDVPPAWRAPSERESLVWKLACARETSAVDGLRIVYRSQHSARVDGATGADAEGPAATVYELTRDAPPNDLPSLSPR